MIEVLRKIFEANPEKSTVTINGKCSDCGREVIVEIEPTSGGYGLQGGMLVKRSPDKYSITCPDCYKFTSRMETSYRSKSAHA
jgi:DNA-directed RNA polymerase subunit RPC12/RpoP